MTSAGSESGVQLLWSGLARHIFGTRNSLGVIELHLSPLSETNASVIVSDYD